MANLLFLHLHSFAICIALFHLSNAAMLPLVLNALAKRSNGTALVVSAALIVPQIVVAIVSPRLGRAAENPGISTTAAGWIADRAGTTGALLALAALGGIALVTVSRSPRDTAGTPA